MRRIIFLFLVVVSGSALFAGPYAPPAGQAGSTAIYMDDASIVAWATEAIIERGFIDVSRPELGYVGYGDDANCLGSAQGGIYDVVSLGDGGVATLSFQNPITNEDGNDFVVFENSYNNTFLELGFVEVSSDGNNFFRFEAVSLTDPNIQVGTFGSVDTTNIHNLTGKYRCGYGTPFDLQELAGIEGLDINSITHVRIIDVVGCIQPTDFNNDGFVNFLDYSVLAGAYFSRPGDTGWNQRCDIAAPYDFIDWNDIREFIFQWLTEWSSIDSLGNKINDPWPTPFDTGGFDLDAVGVIHQRQP